MLKNAGLPECEEGVLILTRTVHRTKMPRIQINGSMATLAQLQEFGVSWIDFHGPGEPQRLFQEKHQLEMLDSFAGNTQRLEKYQSAYTEWIDANRRLKHQKIENGSMLTN